MPRLPGEFALIERYLAPLTTTAAGAFGLKNDAAVLELPPGERLVVTADSLVAGGHFLPDDPPETIGRKVLRVSLSDLAAMGARPHSYLLAASWPGDLEEAWIAAFCRGLAADQERFGLTLVGGDTTATSGPMTFSLTAFGAVKGSKVLDRASLRPGDDLYVSGTLGDAYLGLKVLRDGIAGLTAQAAGHLADRYRCPEPRLALGQAILEQELAASALDVSDGLAQDLGHLLAASAVGAEVELEAVPVSNAAEQALSLLGEPRQAVLSGGDDYELLFAATQNKRPLIDALSSRLTLPIARIGRVRAEAGLTVVDSERQAVPLESLGWTHF
ncbi:thiamine-phosphate kinase [Pelagibius sp.]|uniref:thiamine-phosphate kinase n=1 Tax=Pelagibius sp. TaxID=1931238 RepID=UPI0026043BFC|nr:thiamine-phosphate kinase [Pelagibius sp.]